jgi:hypothetical protein
MNRGGGESIAAGGWTDGCRRRRWWKYIGEQMFSRVSFLGCIINWADQPVGLLGCLTDLSKKIMGYSDVHWPGINMGQPTFGSKNQYIWASRFDQKLHSGLFSPKFLLAKLSYPNCHLS